MNRTDRRTWTALAIVATLLTAACDDGATTELAPEPGTIEARLVTDATDIGAVILRIDGTDRTGSMTEPPHAARDDLLLFTARTDRGWTVAVLGEDLRGALLRWDVPDVAAADGYRLDVVEAADRANGVLDEAVGARVAVIR